MTRGGRITGETPDEASASFLAGLQLQTAPLRQHYLCTAPFLSGSSEKVRGTFPSLTSPVALVARLSQGDRGRFLKGALKCFKVLISSLLG